MNVVEHWLGFDSNPGVAPLVFLTCKCGWKFDVTEHGLTTAIAVGTAHLLDAGLAGGFDFDTAAAAATETIGGGPSDLYRALPDEVIAASFPAFFNFLQKGLRRRGRHLRQVDHR